VANDLSSRYPKENPSGAIADLRNRSVRLTAGEPFPAYPDYIAVLTEGLLVQGSTGRFFVSDHVSSTRLNIFHCEINAIYTDYSTSITTWPCSLH
jgi:hypothetical protein